MNKTTVYLPDELKQALSRIAAESGRSEAEVIRDAIGRVVSSSQRPRPKGALFASGDPALSESLDQALAGFGEH
ncbi:MAG: CopG family transcriptional regulator [Actinomycetes bacterium]